MENPNDSLLEPNERMKAIDDQISHMWMVRAFLKHSDEAADDEELAEVHRRLYDYMLALGPSLDANDPAKYLRIAKKKLTKLLAAAELFHEIQPDVSGHTNFRMASHSLRVAVARIKHLLQSMPPGNTDSQSKPGEPDMDDDDEETTD
jgi:hypothetical protein